MSKTCVLCSKSFDSSLTHGGQRNVTRPRKYCSDSCRAKARRASFRAARPDYFRWATMKSRYGLSPAAFDAMVEAQGGRCKICRSIFADREPHIDHDHACCPGKTTCGRCIRGLLCRGCNNAIGDLKDDPILCRQAALYLQGEL